MAPTGGPWPWASWAAGYAAGPPPQPPEGPHFHGVPPPVFVNTHIRHNKRHIVINVSRRTFFRARLKVDLAFHLRQVLFLSKFRKKNDSALYTAHAYLYLNVRVRSLQFYKYTLNL